MDTTKLALKIQSLDGLTREEKDALLKLLRKTPKYGLVWEDKTEAVEERLRDELPVLIEDESKRICPPQLSTDNQEVNNPNHIIIEGDNLEALTALSYTHAGKIDVIYIDPPYNTGNKDFVYNDSYVDSEDTYRHSKWLSFMAKRLRIAKKLLSDRGVIFISIDDNEQANLKLLCDEVFGERNFVSIAARRRRKSQANLSKSISPIHEYVLIYLKNNEHELNKIAAQIDLSEYHNPDNDPRGPYKTMPCTNRGGSKYSVVTPTGRVIEDEWRFKIETYRQLEADNRLVFPRGGAGKPRYKLFLSDKKDSGVVANTWWDELESNQDGAIQLKNILGGCFNNPKPVGLITFILKLGSNTNSTILDFFAGSGTTMHAVMQLNAEDGGKRTCILCTNNENGICENVTYERNKRVIEGYTKPNGEHVEGLHHNNLRYYRTAYVGRSRTMRNMRRLMDLSTDMLCIKEDLYAEKREFAGLRTHKGVFRFFDDSNRQMLVIYREEAVTVLVSRIAETHYAAPIKVYVFSPSEDPWEGDFEDVAQKVKLCALPQAIYNTYKRILPKPNDRADVPDDNSENQENLGGIFDTTQKGGEA